VAEAMVQCKASDRAIPLGARKLKAEASAVRCTKTTHRFRHALNNGAGRRGLEPDRGERKLPAL